MASFGGTKDAQAAVGNDQNLGHRTVWGNKEFWKIRLPPRCLLFWWKTMNRGLPLRKTFRDRGF